MSKKSSWTREERVIGHNARIAKQIAVEQKQTSALLDRSIVDSEAALAALGATLPARPLVQSLAPATNSPQTFDALVRAAPPDASIHDALDEHEIEAALARLRAAGDAVIGETALDRWDWAIAGTAGLLAGVVDVVLVGVPKYSMAFGGPEGGPLSNSISEAVGRILPPQTIARLEKMYPVSYDRASSRGLLQIVDGLSGRSHRFQSLGHDPFLAWIFGVCDVLRGTMTAIGRDGSYVVQAVGPAVAGQNFFGGVFGAFHSVAGHLASDVATSMGLPAPLMPLAQFLQFGHIGERHESIAEIARRMYLEGYDFRHFLAGGIATALVEVVIRGAWIIRRLREGASLRDALPNAAVPRLRRQLLLGHAVAAAVNAGKIAITQNPCSLNWSQWLALFRYIVPEVQFILVGERAARAQAEEALLDADLIAIGETMRRTDGPVVVV